MPRYLSRETEPFGKWNGIPIYLTTIFVAVMVLGLVVCAFLQVAGSVAVFQRMYFIVPRPDWDNALALFLYPLVDEFHFFTPFAIFCMYGWSVGIETHLGRRVLIKLIALLIVVPAAVAALLAHSFGVLGVLDGNIYMTCGMVIAFATLYPNAEWFGGIPFKFVAVLCVFTGSLMVLVGKKWIPLFSLWSVCLVGFFYIRYALAQEYDDYVPLSARFRQLFRRKPKFRIVRKDEIPPAERWAPEPVDDAVSEEVDAILDKVARSGLDSLTAKERKQLEKARQDLQRRDGK